MDGMWGGLESEGLRGKRIGAVTRCWRLYMAQGATYRGTGLMRRVLRRGEGMRTVY